MKQSDVIIGAEYMTNVSGVLRLVTVLSSVEGKRPGDRKRFSVKRSDNGRVLMNRTAAALRKTKKYGNTVVEDKGKPDLKKIRELSKKELGALDEIDVSSYMTNEQDG